MPEHQIWHTGGTHLVLTGRTGGPILRRVMQHDELVGLAGRLQWGTPASRRELAEHLVQCEDRPTLALLADTVRADEGWRLRVRCLEVLGLAAAQADRQLGEHILGLLLDRGRSAPGGHTSAR